MSKIFKFMILSIIFYDSAFCIGIWDYDTELINGYRLIRTNSPSVFIFKKSLSFSEPEYPVVPPKITGLNIYGNIIVGETEFTPVGDDCDASVSGFFILDTETNKLKIGLKKEQWLKILRNMGLEKEPTLIEPSRSFRPSTENIKLSNMPDLRMMLMEQIIHIRKNPVKRLALLRPTLLKINFPNLYCILFLLSVFLRF
jgi:hypothetical protein